MLNILKKYDLIDELDDRIQQDENVFIECYPNKIPFMLRLIKPYVLIEIFVIFIDFIYGVIKPETIGVFLQGFEIALVGINIFPVYLLVKSFYEAFLKVNNTYYVVTDRGIHILEGGKSLDYTLYTYDDIKSLLLNKYKFSRNKGDIILKEIAEKDMKKISEKFFYTRTGLIAVDEVKKVYDILKHVSIQENPGIFFADEATDLPIDYYKDVKKYNKKINIDKDDSIIKRRS